MDLSVVVPVFNECESIELLIDEITFSLKDINYEIVIVDDNSSDNTLNTLDLIKSKNKKIRIIKHKQNYGQSFAVRTGVRCAKAKWVATIDGDGQNDPADILNLYYDLLKENKSNLNVLIAGNRKKRRDSFLKKISSKYANKIRAKILKDGAPDTGCGLKLFSRDFFLELPHFNHMHRYVPALYVANGGKVVSIEVNHRFRQKGFSKYGFNNRFWVGITDIFGVRWLQRRSKVTNYEEI